MRIGVLGAGHIATRPDFGVLPHVDHLADKATVVAVADAVPGRARTVADEFGIVHAFDSLDDMLECDIDAVLNLTPIRFHAETSLAILRAGKHLATEKPIATSLAEAMEITDTARSENLMVVSSPPNMLYPDRMEARRLIESGAIGKVAYSRFRASHAGPAGMASWPTDPTWFYQTGAGPLFDLGIYGVHEAIGILGAPAKAVTALSGIAEPVRIVRGGPFQGKRIEVTADDNNVMLIDFGQARFAVVDGSYTVHATRSPRIELYGSRGTLALPYNIDTAEGSVLEIYTVKEDPASERWEAVNLDLYAEAAARASRLKRAILLDHLIDCVRKGLTSPIGAEVATHGLEILLAAQQSARTGRTVELETSF